MALRAYIVAGFNPQTWRRIISPQALPPALFWCAGSGVSHASKTLASILSEKSIGVRWIPLSHRPNWLEEVFTLPWKQTALASLMQETPHIVLEASEEDLLRIWQRLNAQGLVESTYFLPSYTKSPLLSSNPLVTKEAQIIQWSAVYEELSRDWPLILRWIPCTLIPAIS